jgi:membrane protease subunit HflC
MKLLIRIAIVALCVLWLRSAFYAVDFAEFAYVTRFGDPIATLDGGTDAGLHLKLPWPIDSVQRIDRRLQSFDLPAVETLTRDLATKSVDKTLAVDAYLTWKIPDAAAADRFVKAVGTPEQARRILAPRINGRLAAIIGGMPLDELIAVADEKAIEVRTEKIRQAILADGLRDKVLGDYGIEIVDLRARRFSYPEAVRASIAERIRSDRQLRVAAYESEGRRRAAEISSTAEKEARTMEAEARAQKTRLEGQADVEADRLRNEAHSADPAFYAFLQKLRTYQALLSETRDVLLLSSKHPLFDLLLTPPKP